MLFVVRNELYAFVGSNTEFRARVKDKMHLKDWRVDGTIEAPARNVIDAIWKESCSRNDGLGLKTADMPRRRGRRDEPGRRAAKPRLLCGRIRRSGIMRIERKQTVRRGGRQGGGTHGSGRQGGTRKLSKYIAIQGFVYIGA